VQVFVYFGVENGKVVYANLCPEDESAGIHAIISTAVAPSYVDFEAYAKPNCVGSILSFLPGSSILDR
jgi:hypothetical protein